MSYVVEIFELSSRSSMYDNEPLNYISKADYNSENGNILKLKKVKIERQQISPKSNSLNASRVYRPFRQLGVEFA